MDGAATLGSPVTVNSSGVAIYQTPALAVGVHQITASYGGDSTHFDSSSAAFTQTVVEGAGTVLASSANPSAVGQSVTFTATVGTSGGGGVTPDGTVTFTDGSTFLSTAPLSAGGVATFATTTLADGLHSITATYNGDSAKHISGSVSNVLKQDVQARGPPARSTFLTAESRSALQLSPALQASAHSRPLRWPSVHTPSPPHIGAILTTAQARPRPLPRSSTRHRPQLRWPPLQALVSAARRWPLQQP